MSLTVPTKESPAPLDAFESAKPDEPIWTVQGGDPLGPPLLRIWAYLARIRAGVIRVAAATTDEIVTEAIAAAQKHTVEGNDAKVRELKVRATLTEEISWGMEEYAAGIVPAVVEEAPKPKQDDLGKIDLHSTRVRSVSRLSNMEAELVEIANALRTQGYDDEHVLDVQLPTLVKAISLARNTIEPRRSHKG